MSSSKAFVVPVKLRDALVDMKGLSPEAKGIFVAFWFTHEMYREPLPPREFKGGPSEWDEWFRDKLDMKNVRTWRRIRDELLAHSKIRRADDGRLFIGRTMRAVEEKRGGDPARWGGESDQGSLELQGVHAAQRSKVAQAPVGNPVESGGESEQSTEVRAMIGQSSVDHCPICLPKPLILRGRRALYSYSQSQSHETVVAVPFVAPRARGDPAARQA